MPPRIDGDGINPRIPPQRLSDNATVNQQPVNPIDEYFRNQLIAGMRTGETTPPPAISSDGTRGNGPETIAAAAVSTPGSLRKLADIARMMRLRDSFHT